MAGRVCISFVALGLVASHVSAYVLPFGALPFGGISPLLSMPFAAPIMSPFSALNPLMHNRFSNFNNFRSRQHRQNMNNRMNLVTRPYDPLYDSIEGGAAWDPMFGGLGGGLGGNFLYANDNSFDNVNVMLPAGRGLGASNMPLAAMQLDNLPSRDIGDSAFITGSGNTVERTTFDKSFQARGADLSDATIIVMNGGQLPSNTDLQRRLEGI